MGYIDKTLFSDSSWEICNTRRQIQDFISEARLYCFFSLGILAHSHSELHLESIVCYFNTLGNNLGIKHKFTKYFKESCCSTSG